LWRRRATTTSTARRSRSVQKVGQNNLDPPPWQALFFGFFGPGVGRARIIDDLAMIPPYLEFSRSTPIASVLAAPHPNPCHVLRGILILGTSARRQMPMVKLSNPIRSDLLRAIAISSAINPSNWRHHRNLCVAQ